MQEKSHPPRGRMHSPRGRRARKVYFPSDRATSLHGFVPKAVSNVPRRGGDLNRMAAKKAPAKKAPAKKSSGGGAKRKPNAAFMKEMTPSASLAEIVGAKPLPRTEVVKKLWAY